MMNFDVIIVGAGPAGIFSALELADKTDLKVLLLDRGSSIDKRKCPASRGLGCLNCDPCSLLAGWGGAGAYSDGKLTLSTEVGGWLNEYCNEEKELWDLLHYVDDKYIEYGATKHIYSVDQQTFEKLEQKASLAGLKLVQQKVRHMGTEKCAETLHMMREHIADKVDIRMRSNVKTLLVEDGKIQGVETTDGEKFYAKYVILAPGRIGAQWLKTEAELLGLKTLNNPVDIGVRVELQAAVMANLTKKLYEPKLIYHSKSFDDQVRTFCVSPLGEVITESYDGVLTVNGQSYAERKTKNTNFAILVSTSFTKPFREPIAYGKYIARLSNLLSGSVIVQRLGDLKAGRRSTEARIKRSLCVPTLKNAVPGDLSFVLPYRYLADIKEMLQALDKISPGVYSNDTLLYGVEVKFYSTRLELTRQLETKIKNVFTIGDGAGVSRGLIQASASGVIVANEIAKREKQNK
ncbi:MAG: NAD(P)/FAD-dependent oxidoreductase [Candidatus Bathyarchaeota archaeon]